MKIQLSKEYSIQGDSHQWILAKKVSNKDTYVGYYADIKVLLQDYIDISSRTNENIKTVQELLDYQKSLVSALNKAIHPLKIEVKPLEKGTGGG